jgi:hypothetical protein
VSHPDCVQVIIGTLKADIVRHVRVAACLGRLILHINRPVMSDLNSVLIQSPDHWNGAIVTLDR